MSAVVGGHSRRVSPRALFHGLTFQPTQQCFLRSIILPWARETGETARARALEQYATSTSGPFCAHDVVLFPRRWSCTKLACSSFCTATIESGPSCSSEPLPPQLITESPQHDKENNISRNLQIVERGKVSLIEGTSAR